MIDWIKRYLAPPVFEDLDEDRTRVVGPLNAILLILLTVTLGVVAGLLASYGMPADFDYWFTVLSCVTISIASVGLLFLLRRGYVQMVGVLLSSVIWVIITLWVCSSGYIFGASTSAYFLVIIIAGLTLGGRAAIAFGLACILAMIGAFYAQADGVIPPLTLRAPEFFDLVELVLILSMAALLMHSAARSTAEAFERARCNERDLRESEEKYRSLIEQSGDAIYLLYEDRFEVINSKFQEIFGVMPEQVNAPDFDFMNLVAPKSRALIAERTRRLAKGQEIGPRYEFTALDKDGREIEVEVSVSYVSYRGGIATQSILRDITERKRVEEALRKSEALFHSLVESLPQNIYTKDLESRFTFANQRYCATEGKSLADILGKTDFDLHPPGLAKKYRQDDRRVIETQQVFETVEEHKPIEGESFYVQVIKTPLYDARGQAIGTLGIFWDITERRRTEAEILRLQRLLQSITDSMPSALIALDTNGQILLWNPAAEALTGRMADQVWEQSLWQACPELTRHRDLFERALYEGQVAHLHKERVTTEAGLVYCDVSVFPLVADDVDSTGSPRVEGAVLRIDDVTRRVQLEEMMLQSAKLVSIGELAAGVAHEINNPLSAMIQSAQVLQMAFDTQRPRTRERLQACGVEPEGLNCYLQERGLMDYLDGIRTTGGRAAKIVSDLLSFSRQAPFQARPHDLNALMEQTLELAATDYDLRKKYDFRDIEIVCEFAPDLPQVVCDSQQIQQVVLNLVRNAAQAMAGEIERGDREYRPRLTLRTTYREESRDPQSALPVPSRVEGSGVEGSAIRNRMVRLEVEDNGPGIPEVVRARLFDPFFTTKEVGEGTGLGLWLCWSVVAERHGGQIWTESVEEGGVRFVVELPLVPVQAN